MKRAIILVLDSLGVGAAPDAERFGDSGADTLGHNAEQIKKAIEQARAEQGKPTLICCKTTIGFGSPNKEGKEECHGAPLGAEKIRLTKARLGWAYSAFEVPNDVYAAWDGKEKGTAQEQQWNGLDGRIVGMSSFGESAPADELYPYFDITVAAILEHAEALLT